MPPNLTILPLLTGSCHALPFAAVLYTGYPHPDTPFIVAMVLLLYVFLILAPLVFLPYRLLP